MTAAGSDVPGSNVLRVPSLFFRCLIFWALAVGVFIPAGVGLAEQPQAVLSEAVRV